MKKKSLIAIGIIAVVALIGAGIFVATRNSGSDAEPVVVNELPELETQEIETVEVEPEVIEEEPEEVIEVEEVIEADADGVDESEAESIVTVESNEDDTDETEVVDTTETTETVEKAETATSTKSTETANNNNVQSTVEPTNNADAWAAFGEAAGVPVEHVEEREIGVSSSGMWE